MAELVAIKVKIGLRQSGQADHPDFGVLPVVEASLMDWAKYIDVVGGGWHYDKVSGHDHEDLAADSPRGTQWGCLLVDEQFGIEAIAQFPLLVERLNEAEFETFHDNRAHAHESAVREDPEAIGALVDRKALGEVVSQAEIDAALDPDDVTPGRRRNKRKRWADRKVEMGATIKAAR